MKTLMSMHFTFHEGEAPSGFADGGGDASPDKLQKEGK